MANKPQQYNIGDRVMVVGTITGTPDAGSIVGVDSIYRIAIDKTDQKYDYAINFDALSPVEEKSLKQIITRNEETFYPVDVPVNFPFTKNISEIQIKYK